MIRPVGFTTGHISPNTSSQFQSQGTRTNTIRGYEKDLLTIGAVCGVSPMVPFIREHGSTEHKNWELQKPNLAYSSELHHRGPVPFRSALRLYIWS